MPDPSAAAEVAACLLAVRHGDGLEFSIDKRLSEPLRSAVLIEIAKQERAWRRD